MLSAELMFIFLVSNSRRGSKKEKINQKEGIMAVKILIHREFKDVSENAIMALLVNARSIAMTMPGYDSTETLVNLDNPRSIVLISTWETKADWDNYFNSDVRKENERKFAEILARETRYELFRTGFRL